MLEGRATGYAMTTHLMQTHLVCMVDRAVRALKVKPSINDALGVVTNETHQTR